MTANINLLVNLPAGFFKTPAVRPILARMRQLAKLKKRSWNTADEIRKDLSWAHAVIMWSWPALTPNLLAGAPRLRFAGHIDLGQNAAAVELDRGLAVSVSRAGFSPAVAEMALALILSTLRKTSDYHAAMRIARERWVNSFPDDIDPLERQLTGRPVGIIGFGRIGRRLAELLQPFQGAVRVYDPFLPSGIADRAAVSSAPLIEVIKRSDVVVLAAAANAGSRHMLGAREIRAFRRNAVLINVARAGLVDTAALITRLQKRDLFAAVDVFDLEPLPRDHPLRKLPNVYLTPHRAGGVIASVERILNYLVDDLESHLAGRPLTFALRPEMIPALDA